MEIKMTNFNKNDVAKLATLLTVVSDLEMDVTGYGEIAKNENSGNVYVWAEDYMFTTFVGYNHKASFAWTCSNCGEEFFLEYTEGMTIADIENWCASLEHGESECESCFSGETESDEE